MAHAPPHTQDIYWKLVVAAESLPSAQRVAAESSSPALWLTAKLTRAGLPLTPQKPGYVVPPSSAQPSPVQF
jgi:hypothetical protein